MNLNVRKPDCCMHSLISTFVICCLENIVLNLALCQITIFYLVSVAERVLALLCSEDR